MRSNITVCALVFAIALVGAHYTIAGQVPAAASDPDIPVSHQDRVYSAEQYSNTVSVKPIPPITGCSAQFILAIRCRPISVLSTGGSCWYTAWGFPLIITPSSLLQSVRTR